MRVLHVAMGAAIAPPPPPLPLAPLPPQCHAHPESAAWSAAAEGGQQARKRWVERQGGQQAGKSNHAENSSMQPGCILSAAAAGPQRPAAIKVHALSAFTGASRPPILTPSRLPCPASPHPQHFAHLAVAAQAPRVFPAPLVEDEHLTVQELLLRSSIEGRGCRGGG